MVTRSLGLEEVANENPLDEVIHAPNRLQICAILAPLKEAEFRSVRDAIGLSDSVLSKHIKKLEAVGYVTQRKATVDGRQKTWVRLTGKGRKAFAAHVNHLRDLLDIGS